MAFLRGNLEIAWQRAFERTGSPWRNYRRKQHRDAPLAEQIGEIFCEVIIARVSLIRQNLFEPEKPSPARFPIRFWSRNASGSRTVPGGLLAQDRIKKE